MSLEAAPSELCSFSNRKDKASKAFLILNGQRSLLSACTTQWEDLEHYLYSIEQSLRSKISQLSEREQAFESKISQAAAALDEREKAASSTGQGQDEKNPAKVAVPDGNKKVVKDRLGDNAHGAPVVSASLAMAVDSNAPAAKADNSLRAGSAAIGGSTAPANLVSAVTVRPELRVLFEKRDCDGLRNFFVEHRKDINSIRNEFLSALQDCDDPCLLILKAVEGYQDLPLDPSRVKETEAAIRRACVFLLECLAHWLCTPVRGRENPSIPCNVKESVKTVASRWRSRIDANEVESPLDAHAFLQLLATFGIAAEFPDDDLCKIITSIARRKQTPALCRSLGLTAKVPALVDKLAKDGKQMEALAFAHSFGLMERLDPVPMLKSYLVDARKEAETLAKGAPHEPTIQDEAAIKELFALRAVINAIEEYSLSTQYSTEELHARVIQIEKEKLERKRVASAVKQQAKRFRPSGARPKPSGSSIINHNAQADGGVDKTSALGQAGILSTPLSRGFLTPTNLAQFGGTAISPLGQAMQGGFAMRPGALYGSPFAAGNRLSLPFPNSYQYPHTDVLGSSLLGSTSAYGGLSQVYGNYQLGSGLTPNSFLR